MCGVEKDEKSRGCLKQYLDVTEIFEPCSKHYPSLVIGFLTLKKKETQNMNSWWCNNLSVYNLTR